MTCKLLLFCGGLGFVSLAQGSDLIVASAIVSPGGSASLGVGLTVAGTAPAGLQWTIGYSSAQISAMSITAGPATSAAGKTLSCVAASGAAVCLVAGLNRNSLGSGNLAFLNATLAPGVTAASIQITKAIAVDAAGNGLSLASVTGGTIGAPSLLPLTCAPSSLGAGAKSTCTVRLTQAAPSGGSAVVLSSNNGLLTVPGSVTVPSGAAAATFNATAAGTIASNQSAIVKATFGGSSQTATVNLVSTILLSTVACAPASLTSGAKSACTVTLTGPAPAGGSRVALTSNSGLLTVPISVTVPAGAALATFSASAGAIASNQNAIVTATMGAISRTATFSLTPSVLLSKLTCAPSVLGRAATGTCTVFLTSAAGGNGTTVALNSNNFFLTVPSSATVPPGAMTVNFSAHAGSFRSGQTAIVTASMSGSSATASLSLSTSAKGGQAAQVSSLSCPSEPMLPGTAITCELLVTENAQAVSVELASSSAQVRLPAVVTTRPDQSSLTFRAESSADLNQQAVTLTAKLGGAETETTLRAAAAAPSPLVQVPAKQVTKAGAPVSFQVNASDGSELPLQIQASALPDGASFDPLTGAFKWKPTAAQAGKHQLQFTAMNSARQSTTVQTEIEVDAGLPVLNAAAAFCSPGAIARLNGKWLAPAGSRLSDPSGNSLNLGGTSVTIDGQAAPVLYSSADRVDFLCPDLAPQTDISVQATSAFGASQPAKTTVRDALPAILTLEGQNQGLISFEGMNDLAMERNFRVPSHPAQPGDRLVIHATGVRSAASLSPGAMMVKVSDVYAGIDSVEPVPGYAGVYGIHFRVPAAMTFGAAPVQLQLTMPGGAQIDSNSVTAFFEAVRQ